MHEYVVTFWCDGDVSDIYVHASNEADAIELASYGIEGHPEMVTDMHTGKTHYGNTAKVDPQTAADLCDYHGLPWYTDGWPYTSGIKVCCDSDDLWKEILAKSTY